MVIDAGCTEVIGPGLKGGAVRYGEGQVVHCSGFGAGAESGAVGARKSARLGGGRRSENDHDPGSAVPQGDVPNVKVVDIGLETEDDGVPLGAGSDIGDQ